MTDAREPPPTLLADLLREVWPGTSPASVLIEPVEHHGHNAHWYVRDGERRLVLREARSEAGAQRVVAALEALEAEPFAPALYGWRRTDDGGYLIAMELIEGSVPTPTEVRVRLDDFVDVVRRVHAHTKLRQAVQKHGLVEPADFAAGLLARQWERLRHVAPEDPRVAVAARWVERVRAASEGESRDTVEVSGHGDLHRENWRLTSRGPVLLDWEDIGFTPLGGELASLIVYADLVVADVATRYGAPAGYVPVIEAASQFAAVVSYVYWLRLQLDGSNPRPDMVDQLRAVCERLLQT